MCHLFTLLSSKLLIIIMFGCVFACRGVTSKLILPYNDLDEVRGSIVKCFKREIRVALF